MASCKGMGTTGFNWVPLVSNVDLPYSGGICSSKVVLIQYQCVALDSFLYKLRHHFNFFDKREDLNKKGIDI